MSPYLALIIGIASAASVVTTIPARAEEKPANAMVVAKYSESPSVTRKLNFRTEIAEKYEYYDVSGANPSEIRRQMNKNGTKWDDGETYDALTTWEIKYRYDTAWENGRCHVSSARTDVGIIFRYPRWTASSETPDTVRSQWNTYMDHLRAHENGHKDLAVKAAQEISDSLSAMGSFDSCGALDDAAATVAREKLAHLKQIQKDYDSTTRHGATQGAVFP